jgi:hypothetical protein
VNIYTKSRPTFLTSGLARVLPTIADFGVSSPDKEPALTGVLFGQRAGGWQQMGLPIHQCPEGYIQVGKAYLSIKCNKHMAEDGTINSTELSIQQEDTSTYYQVVTLNKKLKYFKLSLRSHPLSIRFSESEDKHNVSTKSSRPIPTLAISFLGSFNTTLSTAIVRSGGVRLERHAKSLMPEYPSLGTCLTIGCD